MLFGYRIEYEYYDKRNYIRTKKIECGDIERVKYYCDNINNLVEHKPIRIPRITKVREDLPDIDINYNKILKGEIYENI